MQAGSFCSKGFALPHWERQWSAEYVLDRLLEYKRLAYPLSEVDMLELDRPTFDAACRFYLIRDIKYLCSHYDAAIKNYGRRLLTAVKSMFKVIHNRDNYSSPEAFEEALK